METDLQLQVDALQQQSHLWHVRIPRGEEVQCQGLQVSVLGSSKGVVSESHKHNNRLRYVACGQQWSRSNISQFVSPGSLQLAQGFVTTRELEDTRPSSVGDWSWQICI